MSETHTGIFVIDDGADRELTIEEASAIWPDDYAMLCDMALEELYECPYCGKTYKGRDAPDGQDIACCGEVGHCFPHKDEDDNQPF